MDSKAATASIDDRGHEKHELAMIDPRDPNFQDTGEKMVTITWNCPGSQLKRLAMCDFSCISDFFVLILLMLIHRS